MPPDACLVLCALPVMLEEQGDAYTELLSTSLSFIGFGPRRKYAVQNSSIFGIMRIEDERKFRSQLPEFRPLLRNNRVLHFIGHFSDPCPPLRSLLSNVLRSNASLC